MAVSRALWRAVYGGGGGGPACSLSAAQCRRWAEEGAAAVASFLAGRFDWDLPRKRLFLSRNVETPRPRPGLVVVDDALPGGCVRARPINTGAINTRRRCS
jgi:hypothetical protein